MCWIYVAGVIVAGSRPTNFHQNAASTANRSPKISESSCDWDRRQTQAAVSDQCRAPGQIVPPLITDRGLLLSTLQPVDLGGHDEVALGKAVDLVRPERVSAFPHATECQDGALAPPAMHPRD